MQKANGLGSKIDNAIEAMKSAYKNDCKLSKKQLYDIAVKAAGGEMNVTKVASRQIWSAIFRTIATTTETTGYPSDYRKDTEYR